MKHKHTIRTELRTLNAYFSPRKQYGYGFLRRMVGHMQLNLSSTRCTLHNEDVDVLIYENHSGERNKIIDILPRNNDDSKNKYI